MTDSRFSSAVSASFCAAVVAGASMPDRSSSAMRCISAGSVPGDRFCMRLRSTCTPAAYLARAVSTCPFSQGFFANSHRCASSRAASQIRSCVGSTSISAAAPGRFASTRTGEEPNSGRPNSVPLRTAPDNEATASPIWIENIDWLIEVSIWPAPAMSWAISGGSCSVRLSTMDSDMFRRTGSARRRHSSSDPLAQAARLSARGSPTPETGSMTRSSQSSARRKASVEFRSRSALIAGSGVGTDCSMTRWAAAEESPPENMPCSCPSIPWSIDGSSGMPPA